jgi:hypothetical protein
VSEELITSILSTKAEISTEVLASFRLHYVTSKKTFTFMITDLRSLAIENRSNTYFSPYIAVVVIEPRWIEWGRE